MWPDIPAEGPIWYIFLMRYLYIEDVEIVYFYIQDHLQELESLAENLNQDEKDRANSYYFTKDKNRYIICRGILRSIIAGKMGTDPKDVRFFYNKYGKPEIDPSQNIGNLQFNVSHSGNYGIIAITAMNQIGIDIELRKTIENMDMILRSQFSTQENLSFSESSDKEKCFFSIWAQKEAVIKASGRGFSFGFRHWSVDPYRDSYEIAAGGDIYRIRCFQIDTDYSAALAVKATHFWYPYPGGNNMPVLILPALIVGTC